MALAHKNKKKLSFISISYTQQLLCWCGGAAWVKKHRNIEKDAA